MKETIQAIPLDLIARCSYQMRKHFPEKSLDELAESMREHGVIEPVVVRPWKGQGGAQFELVCGERRWRAAQRIGLDSLPCIVRAYTDEETAAVCLVENFQRENLSPIETARGISRLIDQFSLTQDAVAEQLGVSHTTVCHYLRLLELPNPVQRFLDEKLLTMGHAKAILSAPEAEREKLALATVAQEITVRKLEALVRRSRTSRKVKQRKDADITVLENALSEAIGASVKMEHDKKRWRGEIRIQYFSEEECQGILERLRR